MIMCKRIILLVMNLCMTAILISGCGRKGSVKSLNADFDSIVIDTTAKTVDGDVCKVHLKMHVFKGEKAAQLNDSLLRMAILQPDYMGICYDYLIPSVALPLFVRRLIAEQQEVFKEIRHQEPDTKPLLYDLSCDTKVLAGANGGYIYIAQMRTADSTGEPVAWTVVRNIAPNGHRIKLEDIYTVSEIKQLPYKIMEKLADNLELEDSFAVREAGYFVGINAYPTSNFALFDDSIRFVYVPGEVSQKAINITLEK